MRVALYVEGSVQIVGDRMRIIVQLIDSETGFHVLSRSFDRLREDFFDIRDEITRLTVANVRVALPPETRDAAEGLADDPSLDVYVLYRRGVEASLLPDARRRHCRGTGLVRRRAGPGRRLCRGPRRQVLGLRGPLPGHRRCALHRRPKPPVRARCS